MSPGAAVSAAAGGADSEYVYDEGASRLTGTGRVTIVATLSAEGDVTATFTPDGGTARTLSTTALRHRVAGTRCFVRAGGTSRVMSLQIENAS